MKEKRTNVTRKKRILSVFLIAILVMMFSSTVSADTDESEGRQYNKRKVYDLDEIVYSSDPVFVQEGDVIRKGSVDLEKNGMRVRYELSESSEEVFPGTQPFYLSLNHEVHGYEYNGKTYTMWRVKYASDADGAINVKLVPANNDSSNYVGYVHNWTLLSEEPFRVTIKNTVEPESCYANFENGSQRVYIDFGTSNQKKLKYDDGDFDYSEGSLIIDVNRLIIHHLLEGEHTLTVGFRDGSCTVKFIKGNDEAHAAGSRSANAVVQTSQQTSTQTGVKKAPKTGEI